MFVEGGCIHVQLNAKAAVKQKEILNCKWFGCSFNLVFFTKGYALCCQIIPDFSYGIGTNLITSHHGQCMGWVKGEEQQ